MGGLREGRKERTYSNSAGSSISRTDYRRFHTTKREKAKFIPSIFPAQFRIRSYPFPTRLPKMNLWGFLPDPAAFPPCSDNTSRELSLTRGTCGDCVDNVIVRA